MGGNLDFRSKVVRLKDKRIALIPVRRYVINPGQSTHIVLRGKFPKLVKSAEFVISPCGKLRQLTATNLLVRARCGTIHIPVVNRSSRVVSFSDFRPLAYTNTSGMIAVVQPATVGAVDHCAAHISNEDYVNLDLSATECMNLENYPHLELGDPLLKLTEKQAMRKQVCLNESILNSQERIEIYNMLDNHRDAFSLYGELSRSKIEVDIELDDDTPFYIRPYPTTDIDKEMIDRELTKLVKLGILREGHKPYTSPVLLVAKRDSKDKRVVTDFRHLNRRIKRINHPFPLFHDTIKRLGNSKAQVLSIVDLKSAFFCLPLKKSAQKYTGIASYHGGKHYYYERLAQGLNVSPGIFQSRINVLLEMPNSRQFCIAHHDDIIVFSKNKYEHKVHLQLLFNALSRNGLKISPQKCKLFRRDANYMGHRILL